MDAADALAEHGQDRASSSPAAAANCSGGVRAVSDPPLDQREIAGSDLIILDKTSIRSCRGPVGGWIRRSWRRWQYSAGVADSFEAVQAGTLSARLQSPRILLRQTNWSLLGHAYGSAEDVPRALTRLTDDAPDVRAAALRHLERVNHQNTIYSATAPAALYIAGILNDPRTIPAINANFSALPTTNRSLRAMLLDWLGAMADDVSAQVERVAAKHGFALAELPEVIALRAARPAIFDAVRRYLNDRDDDVRRSAIVAAGLVLDAPELASHRPALLPPLREVLANDPDRRHRAYAKRILLGWGATPPF
ncbi:hypothetical protein GCM10009557_02430 [Virgisporangium ochraceum]|uniref:HEAT repeat domain-containing protein n=1 Tax=Virgisporangium ochraceum TaxID=65505 RepID=A0A8J4A1F7_9ACTN|nr:hypothetical protein [Virgisporangium ochraceum]GIJ72832.1 hypothetical protein Voc01_077490 [Virgisporangium ochraceum]